MRREDRKIEGIEGIEILNNGEYGILSMCTPGNEGYGIPLNYAFSNNVIYFHCALEGSKIEFLKNNNKVSFCVVGKTKLLPSSFGTLYESAVVSGFTSEVSDMEKTEALKLIIDKYSGEFKTEGLNYMAKLFNRVKIIKLNISSVTGKARKN